MVQQGNASVGGLMMGGLILGFITAMVTIFKKEWAGITAPIYAVFEGLFLGGVSAFVEAAFFASKEPGVASTSNGIVFNAVALTFGVFLLMLLLYRNQIIKPTQKFMMGVAAATGAIFLLYLVNMIMGFFGASMPFLHSNGPLGIGISLVIVVVAALNLIIDFKNIEDAVAQGAPKYMEWFGAFGLMVTLVWLYLEILRLVALLTGRD
jgi:uncharacterized YccA/Bax inhibitor family protein